MPRGDKAGVYRPRLSVELTPEQYQKLSNLMPWGIQRHIFAAIVDDLIDLVESQGEMALAAILAKSISPRESISVLAAGARAAKKETTDGS